MTAEPPDQIDQDALRAKTALAYQLAAGLLSSGAVYVGDKLGLYRAMAGAGALTSSELADRAGLNERYVREWLYQQTATGVLEHRPPDRFELTPEAALVFADVENPASMVGQLAKLPTYVASFERALVAFRSGIGAPFQEVTDPERLSRGALQAWARSALVPVALPNIGDVTARLDAGGAVADVGCGAGAAPLAIAKAFPAATVHGYDTWDAALEICEKARAEAALTNVRFFNPERTPLPSTPTYDLMLTTDCLHDMTRPDEVAAAMRRAIRPDGYWFIVEPDGHPDPTEAMKHPSAQFGYAISLFSCLPSSTSEPDGLGLGTFGLHEVRLRELVLEAGFSILDRVPGIEHPVNAYYVARP